MNQLDPTPTWTIEVTEQGATLNGTPVTPLGNETPVQAVTQAAIMQARNIYGPNRPVRTVARYDGRAYVLAIAGDGTVEEVQDDPPQLVDDPTQDVVSEIEPATEDVVSAAPAQQEPTQATQQHNDPRPLTWEERQARRRAPVEVDPEAWSRVELRAETRRHDTHPDIPVPELRATPTGWGKVTQLFGATPQPTQADHARYAAEMDDYNARVARRDDELTIGTRFVGARVIAVANGKGGAGKTPFSLMLAAAFGRQGAAVACLDNNETRGTLGDRTAQASHNATVRDLLADHARLTSASATSADLMQYAHHQSRDRYDTYQSMPDEMDTAQQLDAEGFHQVMEVLKRFYHYVVVDSGNNQSGGNWLAMADQADAIVVPVNGKADHSKNGMRLLRDLATQQAGAHGAGLARRAVVVVTQASPAQQVEGIAQEFSQLARHVVTVPYDPALEADWLQWDNLNETTQRRILQLGAAVVETLQAADAERRNA